MVPLVRVHTTAEVNIPQHQHHVMRVTLLPVPCICLGLRNAHAAVPLQGFERGLCRKLSSMLAITTAAASCSRKLYRSGLYSFSEGTCPPAKPVYLTCSSAAGSSLATCS